MPLVSSEEMLKKAKAGGYAVPACNIENMEMAQAIAEAAASLHSPVILQTTPSAIRYGSLPVFYALASALAQDAAVPVAIHLDHGDSFELAAAAVRAGYTSVMIDGSALPFEENVSLTKRVAEVCAACGVPVEAELGKVGGKEEEGDSDAKGGYTVPSEAAEFVNRTGVSSLAVAIGTAHGVYKGEPKLDIPRLIEIAKLVEVPLVLHGGSGIPDETVRACIRAGIAKVNYATELRMAFTNGMKAVSSEKPDAFDPKLFGQEGKKRVLEFVKGRIAVCGSEGKA